MSQLDKKRTLIRKSNELIEARYRLSITEQRLVLLLAAEIELNDSDFKDYELKVSDFTSMFGLETDKSVYEQVEQAADNLLGKIITLQEGHDVEKTAWLSYVKYSKGSGMVKIRFDKSLKPYLLQLQGNFTQYNLKHVINFKSQYSIRLYELLKMEVFRAKNGKLAKAFSVLELKDFLGIGKKEYTVFNNFKRRVIQPAVKEISTQTDLNVINVESTRTGRKITSLTFTVQIVSEQKIKEKQQGLLEDEVKKPIQKSLPVIDSLIAFGFSRETANLYEKKYGVKQIERNVAYTLMKQQNGVVNDVPSYLNKAIREDMGGAWKVAQAQQERDKAQRQVEAAERETLAAKAHLKKMQLLAEKTEKTEKTPEQVAVNCARTAAMARQLSALLED